MKTILKLSVAAGLAVVAVAGCSGSGSSGLGAGSLGAASSDSGSASFSDGGPNVTYVQQDRLARPVVNEVLATFANRRHYINDTNNPTNDSAQLKNDIESFLTFPAGRSRAIKDVIKSVLVPDVMIADLSKPGPAAYLGVETGGATGSTFGGRKLTDDVTDTSLAVIFGNAIPAITGVPDDGKEIPSLTSDNVGPGGKRFTNTFPYLGAPR